MLGALKMYVNDGLISCVCSKGKNTKEDLKLSDVFIYTKGCSVEQNMDAFTLHCSEEQNQAKVV